MDEKNEFLGKKVKIFLKNRYCYTGEVLGIDKSQIIILDKFGLKNSINRDEISVIQSLPEGSGIY